MATVTRDPADFARFQRRPARAGHVRAQAVSDQVYVPRVDHVQLHHVVQHLGQRGADFGRHQSRKRVHSVPGHGSPVRGNHVILPGAEVNCSRKTDIAFASLS